MDAERSPENAPGASPQSWPRSPAAGLLAAFGLSLAIAASISLARFSYAIILPAMRDDLGWSYTQAGTLNTVNAVGYLIGSFLAFASVRRLGPKMPFVAGVWLTAITVLATAFVRDFATIAVIRLLSGVLPPTSSSPAACWRPAFFPATRAVLHQPSPSILLVAVWVC